MLKSMFKTPKMNYQAQTAQQTAQAPTIDQAAQQAEDQNRMRRRKGRAGYMMRQQGQQRANAGFVNTATKALTGQ